jgi:hypothetical protein
MQDMRRVLFAILLTMTGAQAERVWGQGVSVSAGSGLPESPGAVQDAALKGKTAKCDPTAKPNPADTAGLSEDQKISAQNPCNVKSPRYMQFLNDPGPFPLTSQQKGILAIRDVIDPFNLLTITANAAFTVGIDSHSAYGPGMRGFGRDVGYSFVQDATGEFIGTYAVCSLLHQDPRYHRDPHATTWRRVGHALKHTVISQHDDGTPMLNYENFITYPASAELANLYVPGVHGNGPSTVTRILTGLATDPANNLITEFLPDFARRFHVRIVFVQQILNQIATSGTF